jgi:hypothetical protein
VKYLSVLVEDLASQAAEAESDLGKLKQLYELVELLDAELIFTGHSRQWRADLVDAVEARWQAGEALGPVVAEELTAHGFGEERAFDVLVALS